MFKCNIKKPELRRLTFTLFSVSIVDFEQVNVSWKITKYVT